MKLTKDTEILTGVTIDNLPLLYSKQILENQEKAELYNPRFKEFYDKWHYVIQENKTLKEKLEEIKKLSFHAGCCGNPNCVLCPIMKILEE